MNKRNSVLDHGKRVMCFAPLLLFLIASEVPLPLGRRPNPGADGAGSNILIFGSIYILSVLILISTWKKSLASVKKTGVMLVMLFGFMLFSFIWTVAPLSVAKELTHFFGVLLIGAITGAVFQEKPEMFFRTIYTFALTVALASIIAAWYRPLIAVGLDGRWMGITAHPNHLGIVSMAGVFSALCITFMRESRWILKAAGLLTIPMFFYCLVKADSITSLMIAFFFLVAIPNAVFIMRSKRLAVALLKVFFFTTLLLTLLLVAYVIDPDIYSIDSFLARVGRSRTLTGRLDLWATGWQAFLERPLAGWGFDNLTTLSSTSLHQISYGQFHNGYLDLLVRGGVIGASIALLFIFMLGARILNALRYRRELAVLLLILFTGLLTHNLTETSLLQFPNSLWLLMVCLHYATFALEPRHVMDAHCAPEERRPLSAVTEGAHAFEDALCDT